MNDFPEFMKNPFNRIANTNQATQGVEGYVFDGTDGSQMAFWTCAETASSAAHVHEFDEYMLVVQGCYTLIIDGDRIPVTAGMEYYIPIFRNPAFPLPRASSRASPDSVQFRPACRSPWTMPAAPTPTAAEP
jgi:hypothetical protein